MSGVGSDQEPQQFSGRLTEKNPHVVAEGLMYLFSLIVVRQKVEFSLFLLKIRDRRID